MADANAELEARIALLTGELSEARAEQAATADVLKVISASAFDLDTVLTTVIRTAIALCDATRGVIWLSRGEQLFLAAHVNYPAEWVAAVQDHPITPAADAQTTSGLAAFTGEVVHVEDVPNDPRFRSLAAHKLGDYKAGIAVPMKRDGKVEGVISMSRPEARLFTDRQVALVQTFADQAVIAIGNARLFDEVQARNRELAETLEQQTATSEILRVISKSPTDIQPVLNAVAESAAQLCDTYDAAIFLRQGEALAVAAHHGPIPVTFATAWPIRREWVTGRAVVDRVPVHVHDLQAAGDEFPEGRSMALRMGHRTILATPLLRDDEAIGALVIRRTEVRPFSDRQIGLLKTFADQAVIAIENVRLFDEVQARNHALTESLEQQTATNDVLSVISSSPTNLQPVFEMIAERSARLCDAEFCAVFRFDGELIHFVAGYGLSLVGHEAMTHAYPMPAGSGGTTARAVMSGKVEQIPDVDQDPHYTINKVAKAVNARSITSVPMLKNNRVVGAINVARSRPGLFPARQIALLQTFADQAVIAIENVRLFDEVQARTSELGEALQQQTATTDVLKVISRSAFDLPTVLQTLVDSAMRLCGADMGAITLREGDSLHYMAGSSQSPELLAYERAHPHPLRRGTFQGRAALEGATIHVPDVFLDTEYERPEAAKIGNFRAALSVPLRRGGEVIGVFGLARREVGPFAQRQIELVESFADQAVIAIENVRLFDEVQARNLEVTEALEQQTATGAILRVIAASPTDIQPVLQVVAESAARFCDTHDAVILLRHDGMLAIKAHHGPIPLEMMPLPITRETVTGRAFVDRRTLHVHDLLAAGEEFPLGHSTAQLSGHRTIVATPLMRDDEAIGALVIRRAEVRPFSDKQINLLKTFADQAVIAIENVRLFDEVQARNREVTEALEQQTATGAILRVIAASPTDIQPVLQVVAESATRFCDTHDAVILLPHEGGLAIKAHYGPIPLDLPTLPINRDWVTGRAFIDRETVHVHDLLAAGGEFPLGQSMADRAGHNRTIAATPLMRSGEAIGVLVIRRTEIRPFSDKQLALVQTFADQAVIAIENVRLFDEVQARTTELGEALQQQTATADVLKVISRSAFDLQTVLDTLVESAIRVCEGENGAIFQRKDDLYHFAASFGFSEKYQRYARENPVAVGRESITGRVALEAKTIHIPDVLADPTYKAMGYQQLGGYRTSLGVPLLREGLPVGVFVLTRPVVRPFTEKQIELVETFADQAVIAIENARLFDEVQARTAELGEALQQQTATADVLKAISRSTFDLRAVLDALAESVTRLCEADNASIVRETNGEFVEVASYGYSPELREYFKDFVHVPGRGTAVGRVLVEGKTVQIPDVLADADYTLLEGQRLGGYRTVLTVPLLREGLPVGVFSLTRSTVSPFTERQIELVQTFADQAVIAIENVRLFDEVQARTAELSEALQQQTATADVLQVISRSAFDLQAVLDTLTESAVRLCRADKGSLERLIDGGFRYVAMSGFPASFHAYGDAHPTQIGRGSAVGRAVEERRIIQIDDILDDPEYTHGAVAEAGGIRTVLAVPLLRQDELIGVFAMIRTEPNPFTAREIELVKTFADQAVIAIENVRLFDEVQARTAELSESLRQQTATSDVLKAISRSTFDLQPVLDTLAESAAKLCDADTSVIFKRDGDLYRWSASYGNLPEAAAFAKANPYLPGRDSVTGRVALEARAVHVSDVLADPEYGSTQLQKLGGYRTILCVPILREGAPVGVFALTRAEVRDFTPRQIELVETFADQSGIAIENVRLFDEVQARTRELSRSLDDLQTAQNRLVQTEKLASLGQLTAGIAHEIKNPLNFVNNFSALSGELIDDLQGVLAEAPLEDSVREEVAELTGMLKGNLEKVVQHGKRADSIVRNMLLHSRAGSGEHRPIDINAVVEESLNLAYHGARAERQGFNVTLVRDFDPQAGEVDLYPQEITRVLLNLISNGFYATVKRGALWNGTPYEPTVTASTRNLGDHVEIRVRDNGTGIPLEVKEKMFNPFFTTKPAGEGTGLGLSLSHDIVVKQHAGTIDVDTKPGEFTEFRIVLPRTAAMSGKSGGEA